MPDRRNEQRQRQRQRREGGKEIQRVRRESPPGSPPKRLEVPRRRDLQPIRTESDSPRGRDLDRFVPPRNQSNRPVVKKSGPNNRRMLCFLIFSIKALMAAAAGSAALGYQVALVIRLFNEAPRGLPPIYFPALGSKGAEECFYNQDSGLSRLEPPPNTFFFGFSPSWINGDLPIDIKRKLGGFNPPLYNTFITVTKNDFEENIIEWNVQQCRDLGALLELSLILDMPVAELPEKFYAEFAALMRRMNSDYGVPILLRFMPEMNGFWMKFGNQPTGQKAAWRRLTGEIRRQTNLTAMLWSPNIAASYAGQRRGDSRYSAEDFAAMDTNRDGALTGDDDQFGPYYPGDDVVDWIGISDYNYDRGAGGAVVVNKPDTFLNPQSSASLSKPTRDNPGFYDFYVVGKNKPFILSETGAPIESNIPGNPAVLQIKYTDAQELQIKQAWWSAVFNSSLLAPPNSQLSRMKAAVWFEISKPENAFGLANDVAVERDFRITNAPLVIDAFVQDVAKISGQLTNPGKFKFECNGNFQVA